MGNWPILALALAVAACSNNLSGDEGPDGGIRDRGADGGFIDPDDGENGASGGDGMGGANSSTDEGSIDEPAEVEITLAAQVVVGEEIAAELVARSSAGDTVELPADMTPQWSSDSPGIATVTASGTTASVQGVGPGTATISVEVGTLSAMVTVEVLETVRESYNGEPCGDVAVAGKDVWACAVVSAEQPDIQGENVLQVCRDGAWINTALITQQECDSCGYTGIVTTTGALCSEAPACAIDYYCD